MDDHVSVIGIPVHHPDLVLDELVTQQQSKRTGDRIITIIHPVSTRGQIGLAVDPSTAHALLITSKQWDIRIFHDGF